MNDEQVQEQPKEILASHLLDVWMREKGKQIPWRKAIEIIAIVTGMPDAESKRLFDMGNDGVTITDNHVARFLSWPLPDSVRPDGEYPAGEWRKKFGVPLTGTNLLTATEAKAMLEHVLGGDE